MNIRDELLEYSKKIEAGEGLGIPNLSKEDMQRMFVHILHKHSQALYKLNEEFLTLLETLSKPSEKESKSKWK